MKLHVPQRFLAFRGVDDKSFDEDLQLSHCAIAEYSAVGGRQDFAASRLDQPQKWLLFNRFSLPFTSAHAPGA